MEGKLITFEGIDGSGKSTQIKMLAGELRSRKFDVLETREPGGTNLGKRLRKAFLNNEKKIDPLAELLLFAADRAQHTNCLIKPALNQGKIVLSDRYADATSAYQGAGRGFSPQTVNQITKLATGGLKPDLTLFFDLSIEKSFARIKSRIKDGAQNNRMDTETVEFYERVRKAYLEIARKEPSRFLVLDANRSIEKIHLQAADLVTDFLMV